MITSVKYIEATPPIPVSSIPYKDLAGWLSIRETLAVVVRRDLKIPESIKIVDEIADQIIARLKTK